MIAPGQRLTGWMQDLTETEWAIVSALRTAQNAEADWDAWDAREAWAFIRTMTNAVRDGDSQEDLTGICDPDQFPVLLAAGVACAECIKHLSKGWRKSRKQGIKRRAAIENPD